MKIAHICLASFYIDNYSYQENILPKYHKKLLFDVVIIASTVSFDSQGQPCLLEQMETEYISSDGIRVIRLKFKNFLFYFNKILRRYSNFEYRLFDEKPDIVFLHGGQFLDIDIVRKYKLVNPNVKIFVDNHADYINSARTWFSKNILHKIVWRFVIKRLEPYVTRFWGVTPSRSDFLEEVYKINRLKIDTLIMGVDLDNADFAHKDLHRRSYREKLGFNDDDYVIISGGKIDSHKKVDQLLKAFTSVNAKNFRLLVFGAIMKDFENQFFDLVASDRRICYLGWQNSSEIYKYLFASDLAVYPGTHSVLWEQTIGIGVPVIIKKWSGFHHLEVNKSIIALESTSSYNLRKYILECYNNKKLLSELASKNYVLFSYENIAKKSIDID
ncbi:glycosyltransferase [Algoriphagus litoralis]|uniref:glycosyltransferase n=1 Tax=Algoriphagus litoralis TaxID=2202829 RepID=UPI000DB9EFCC|nr:glycosyltransferase [Algoriphagus litoralis]